MFRLPVPDLMLRSVYELSPQRLNALGVKLLLLDLDNTLAEYGDVVPLPALRRWLRNIRKAGIELLIFSNSRGERPAHFARALGIEAVGRAKKPNPKKLLSLLKERGLRPRDAALAGDQVYTDIFCAARAGVLAICVRPLNAKAPHRALRYAAEAPFRLAGRLRDRPLKR